MRLFSRAKRLPARAAPRAFAHNVNIGRVGINVPIPAPMAFHSFGGWKRSLFGEDDMHRHGGDRSYNGHKAVIFRWPTGICARTEFKLLTLG
jgi:malonate-semialdehyde dehydrogenase (acetylating)/methylmalonate-semialdehyde dehydrogenase